MSLNNTECLSIIRDIKDRIRAAQYKAILNVNRELVLLYWEIGKTIKTHNVWGNKLIENLARGIKLDFPKGTVYFVQNLKYMAKFSEVFPEIEFVQAPLAQITWRQVTL